MTKEKIEADPASEESVRIDIWLWAVRLWKTRSQAARACRRSQVLINGQFCKPSRQVRVGDTLEVTKTPLTRTVQVKDLLQKRVGAKLASNFYEDLTPEEEWKRAAEIVRRNREEVPKRVAGAGRPTKKERRDLEQVMTEAEEDWSAFQKFAKAFRKKRKS